MKVAFITSGYLPVPASKGGAVEAIVQNIVKENEKFKKLELEIFSIYDDNAQRQSFNYKNTEFQFIKTIKIVELIDKCIYFIAKNILKKEKTMSYRYIMQRLYFLNKVSKFLKANNYDKIIIENHATLFLALKWRKNYQKYKGKYDYHVHNEIKSDYGCAEIIKDCNKILCVSDYIKKHVEERFSLKENNTDILINCIDTDKFNGQIEENEANTLRQKYQIENNQKILLFTGRLSKEKGIKELLEAISMIKTKDFKLLIVGSFFFGTQIKNDFENELKGLIEKVKENVVFTGYVPYEEIQKIYAIADIAVLPSIWEDPAPLTIIEAMASGLPIITTASGGIPEYAKNGCAIIVKRNENMTQDLAKEIEKLIKDSDKMIEMAKVSRENVTNLGLDDFYRDLIEKIK